MALAAGQLSKLFSLYVAEGKVEEGEEEGKGERVNHSDLHDLSIAYGLLVREAVSSQKLCDDLSQEVSLEGNKL